MLNRIINKINYWYISRSALPYWSIICVDFLIIIIAALVSTYLCEGPRELINHFWDRVFTWCCLLVFFFIGMRIFHTYSGIVRYMRCLCIDTYSTPFLQQRLYHCIYRVEELYYHILPMYCRTMVYKGTDESHIRIYI